MSRYAATVTLVRMACAGLRYAKTSENMVNWTASLRHTRRHLYPDIHTSIHRLMNVRLRSSLQSGVLGGVNQTSRMVVNH